MFYLADLKYKKEEGKTTVLKESEINKPHIYISGSQVMFTDLVIEDDVISSYLKAIPEEHREETVTAGLRIGLQALNRSIDSAMFEKIQETRNQLSLVVSNQSKKMTEDVANIKEEMGKVTKDMVDTLQREYNTYFGNENGRVKENFKRMQDDMQKQVESLVNQVIIRFDPEGSNSIPQKMADIINRTWGEQAKAFKSIISVDNPENPLAGIAKDNKHWQETVDNQLATFKKEVQGALNDMVERLGQNKGTADERKGSPRGGFDYQNMVHENLGFMSRPFGDILDDCSTITGLLGTSKVGDHLITINPEETNNVKVTIALESKSDAKQVKNETDLLQILEQTAENRGADVAILVAPSEDILPAGCGNFKIYKNNRIACVYDGEDSLALQIAYRYARTIAKMQRVAEDKEGDFKGLDEVKVKEFAEIIRKSVGNLKKSTTCLNTISRESDQVKAIVKEHMQSILDIVSRMETACNPLIEGDDADFNSDEPAMDF